MQKSSLVDVWLVSKYASGFRNSRQCSVEKAVLKHSAIFTGKHLCWSLFLTNLQAFFPHSDWIWVSLHIQSKCRKKLKKKKKIVATFVLYGCGYLLLLQKDAQNNAHYNCIVPLYYIYIHSKSKVTENIFNLQEWHQNTKIFISYKTFTVGKKLKPAKKDQIWLVVAWYRFFIRWLPFSGPKSCRLIQVWLYCKRILTSAWFIWKDSWGTSAF